MRRGSLAGSLLLAPRPVVDVQDEGAGDSRGVGDSLERELAELVQLNDVRADIFNRDCGGRDLVRASVCDHAVASALSLHLSQMPTPVAAASVFSPTGIQVVGMFGGADVSAAVA